MMDFRGCDGPVLGTLYQCKRCPARFKVKGVFAQLSGRQQARHVDTLLKYYKSHQCTGVAGDGVALGVAADEPYVVSDDSEDDGPATTWTPAAARAVDWTADALACYLLSDKGEEEAPELFKVVAYAPRVQHANALWGVHTSALCVRRAVSRRVSRTRV